MAFTRPSTGDVFTQVLAQQIIKALEGDAGFGQAISLTKLNDAAQYALTVQNLDAVNERAFRALDAAGAVVFTVEGGVPYFGVSPTFGPGQEIPTAGIADLAVTTGKLAAGAVTAAKVAADVATQAELDAHTVVTAAGIHGSATAATADRLVHRDAAGRAKVVAPAVPGDVALQSTVTADIATHQALTSPHGAVSIATALRLIVRDAAGRAKVAAPGVAADIALQSTVTADIATHAALTAAGTHGSTTVATPDRILHRDGAGRGKVVAPAVATDIALKSTVTADIATHAALTAAGTHGSTTAATANRLLHRDAAGRGKVVAPAVAGDIALKSTVDTHAALTNPHSATHVPTLLRMSLWDNSQNLNTENPAGATTQCVNVQWGDARYAPIAKGVTNGDAHDHDGGDGGQIPTAGIANDAVDDTKVGNRVPQFYRRQGGSATDWDTNGTTTRTPTAVRMQAGCIEWAGGAATSGAKTITFPTAFSAPPLIFATTRKDGATCTSVCTVGLSTTQATFRWHDIAGTAYTTIDIHWLAIGPE